MSKNAIIIGAGPAGLTAAYELLKRTDIKPIILEKSGDIGGISKTVNYKGNRMDLGGHRFFSKSDRVMQWWLNIMPIEDSGGQEFTVSYQGKSRNITAASPASGDKVMLVRHRLSRIYFLRKFFTYPVQLTFDTLTKLGPIRTASILLSYLKVRAFPRKPEKSLEDFFINRFGVTLYKLFFKDYTEKVWGVPCSRICAEWGAQRIKGISVAKAIAHAVKSLSHRKGASGDIRQKGTETSMIERFLYPKYGPGHLWEEVARQVQEMGGEVHMHQDVKQIITSDNKVLAVKTIDSQTGEIQVFHGDEFFSTMPVQELIAGMGYVVPPEVQEIAQGLQYRDFITVGVLLKQMPPPYDKKSGATTLPDTWIYIQERDVKVGRLQIFNNWSPYMVKDPDTVWVGMEYFCHVSDAFWQMSDKEIKALAIAELGKMGLAAQADVLDSTVLRMEKTYPAYFGTYEKFDVVRQFTDQFANLFLVGRNGMHKYNNSDHSMLTAMVAVDNICEGVTEKANVWAINTEQEYHEEKVAAEQAKRSAPGPAAIAGFPHAGLAALPTFKDFLLKNPRNKWYLRIAAVAILVQFVIFKHYYPFVGFINGDSYAYLISAYWNLDINTYPTGYSKFLRIFSALTTSDTALVAFQYLMLQASALYFLFTFFFFYKPSRVVQEILQAFFVFNPLFLYLANYVLSDALFIPLSITWFTLLIWIINRPTAQLVLIQAIVLFLAFTVRYNALFYPIIGAVALLRTRWQWWIRLTAAAGSVVLIALFMAFTTNKYQALTGEREFSPFSGWQLANNAMYAYRYVDSFHIKPVPPKFRQLDRMVRTYFDTTRDLKKNPQEMLVASTVYMWDPRSPLQHYMDLQFKKDNSAGTLKKWATVAPLYASYGSWIIRTYPMAFAEHYLWPNTLKYYAPPVEFLDTYNMGKDSIDQIGQTWFHLKSKKVTTLFKDFNVKALDFYPIMAGTLNVVFLFSLLCFLLLGGWKNKTIPLDILWLVIGLWAINFGFSVFASPIALRFQVFPMFVFLTMSLLLLQYIWKAAFVPRVSINPALA